MPHGKLTFTFSIHFFLRSVKSQNQYMNEWWTPIIVAYLINYTKSACQAHALSILYIYMGFRDFHERTFTHLGNKDLL